MSNQSVSELELEIKNFIVSTLHLEDVSAETINSESPLFGDGLGLDSVDALELGVALKKTYGITVDPRAESTREAFSSVKNLAGMVAAKRSSLAS